MSRIVYVLCEGKTEQEFVRSVLQPHLRTQSLNVRDIVVHTGRDPGGRAYRGGSVTYAQFKKQVKTLLADSHAVCVTSLFDFYALPKSFPGRIALGGATERVKALEQAVERDIGHSCFHAYFALHEFEAMLFVDPAIVATVTQSPQAELALQRVKQAFASPEEINQGATTAPSKRLQDLIAGYEKTLHGPLVTIEIGIERIRQACPHFAGWLAMLEAFSTPSTP